MKKILLPFGALAMIASACSNNDKKATAVDDGAAAMSADSLSKNIGILASDDFMGRKPFTEGETRTVEYLKEKYIGAGLEPGNGGSYIQEVPMVSISTKAAPAMKVSSPTGDFSLKGFDDYVIWTDRTEAEQKLDAADLVYAGYGVVAPEYNWNDYAGLDVKGKVVLVRVNDPGFHSKTASLFKGDTMTYYGRWTYKFEEAARQGARGCLIIHDEAGSSYPFSVVQNNWNGTRLRLDNRGKTEALCDVIGWLTTPAANKLLAAAGKDSTLLAMSDKAGFKGESLGLKLTTTIDVSTVYKKSTNVIGRITGSKHPDEVIIYTAHWDHLGIGKPDETGDSIYNGALDNASGTAGLLELARAFKKSSYPPERTIVFLAVTAEEQGLWGSAYYAQNPVYPLDKTLADINMDGLPWYGKTKDIIVIGRGQNDLEDYLKEAAASEGRVVAFEAKPQAGFYYRSDHFNFAKVGVPAIFTSAGTEVIDGADGAGKAAEEEYNEKHYHRPSDQYNPAAWKLDGALSDLTLFYKIGRKLDAATTFPGWKTGSEFKAIREKK
ncbi:MAG: M20/M25/M40 family metallo-hydrolase [Chitinophagaceae bacterium]|nr:MAG: M20/M25/M40 family metallo-hydrolase [Chitinophagaceae bacterium]